MREKFWEEMSVNFTSASSPTMNGKMPHIQCTAEEIGEIVLLPGDPGRVAMFEDLLEDYKIVSNYREYVVGTGYYNGIKVTVCSTGIGGPSTEIAVLQLIALGAKALIRIGGTGVLKEDVPCGAMVLNTGAVRKGGASCLEMEAETIFTLASLNNVLSGSICAVHCNRITDQWLVDFEPAQKEMCRTALAAGEKLYKEYLHRK